MTGETGFEGKCPQLTGIRDHIQLQKAGHSRRLHTFEKPCGLVTELLLRIYCVTFARTLPVPQHVEVSLNLQLGEAG